MHYVKLHGEPTFWLVNDDGERIRIDGVAEMYKNGLHPVIFVSNAELEAIPVVGDKKKKGKGTK